MNYNGNNNALRHAISLLSETASKDAQRAFNQKRLTKVEKALAVRPVWIPLTFTLPAGGQATPVKDTTPALNYDVVIVGAIADMKVDRAVLLTETKQDMPFCSVGEGSGAFANLSDLCGATVSAGNGQRSVFYWPTPYLLESQNRLTLGIFKADVTTDNEVCNVVLLGYRIYKTPRFSQRDQSELEFSINRRRLPRMQLIKQAFDLPPAAGGVKQNIYFPPSMEPLIIRGAKTNLRNSSIMLNIEGEPYLTVDKTPIWAVANHDEMPDDSYLWLQCPIYLPANTTLNATVENSVNGADTDAGAGSYITWITETV